MLDGKKYLKLLAGYKPVAQTCSYCGTNTLSASGRNSFCNFCERYLSEGAAPAQTPFATVRSSIDANDMASALKNADQLMKGSKDPELLYLLGLFYRKLSTIRFQSKDYNLMGFMEPNAESIKDSLDLTTKWKECFFKTIKIIGDELQGNIQIDPGLVFIKFMSEMRLGRFTEASTTLRSLQTLDKRGNLSEYALLVYSVETNTKQADASLTKALGSGELNAYYYLAKYLAKHKKLDEAELILLKLGQYARISMSRELLYRIRLTQEASKM